MAKKPVIDRGTAWAQGMSVILIEEHVDDLLKLLAKKTPVPGSDEDLRTWEKPAFHLRLVKRSLEVLREYLKRKATGPTKKKPNRWTWRPELANSAAA